MSMKIYATLFLWSLLLFFAGRCFGQQDPMFTKYFFNSLVFNPAYAGSNEHLTVNLLHRKQWLGLEGAAQTQSLTAHAPLANERIGLGATLLNDQAGPGGTFEFYTSYAYRFPVGESAKISIGLQAGMTNWRGNWDKLTLEHPTDLAFQGNYSRWMPNFGAGVYFYSERFFVGFGCPRLVEYDLRKAKSDTEALYAKTYRHFYTSAGIAFPVGGNENIVFRPSLLLKTTDWFSRFRKDSNFRNIGAPAEIDVDAAFFFFQRFWVGTALRTAFALNKSSGDSADLWAAYSFDNGVRIGVAYDFPISAIRVATGGSFELMAGYEFDIKVKQVVPPRYF